MTDVVVFIDALSPRELRGVLSEWHQGSMDASVPRVTPRVLSSIYTGQSPANNGMMSVSRYGEDGASRPSLSTFIDRLVAADWSVLSAGMPFTIPFRSTNERSLLHGTGVGGQEQCLPEDAASWLTLPAPDGDMIREHPDTVYASFHDQTKAKFHLFKENIRRAKPDVAFLGYRLIDSYCHFQHTENRRGQPYREHLIETVAGLLDRIERQVAGDVLFFSDHGQTELTNTFRVNRWLAEKGYLEYDVDRDFLDTVQQRGADSPQSPPVSNQVSIGQMGVSIDEQASDVVCDDPFDGCLDLLTDPASFDTEDFREDLLGTGLFRSVEYKWEKYDVDAHHYDTVPDVLPDRDEGVFVSGNVHPEPIGMGYHRTGVHDYTACFGATCELEIPSGNGREGYITPEQMHDVICDFVGLDEPPSPVTKADANQMTPEEASKAIDAINEVHGR